MTYRTRRLGTITNRLTLFALACGVLVGGSSAQGATFLWSPGTPNILLEPKALRQVVTGVTARARGYTVEYTASTARVFGPYPTGSGAGGLKVFGVNVRRLAVQAGEDLGLISQPLSGIAVGGSDSGAGGVWPGFDNKQYRTGNKSITKLDMAVFEFSQAIRINSIKVDQVSNFGRQIWVAACSAAPNFAQGLKAAIAALHGQEQERHARRCNLHPSDRPDRSPLSPGRRSAGQFPAERERSRPHHRRQQERGFLHRGDRLHQAPSAAASAASTSAASTSAAVRPRPTAD